MKIEEKYSGLNDAEVIQSRNKYGINKLTKEKKQSWLIKFIKIFSEPIFLLLIIASSIYFLVGEYIDGIIMLIFVLGICLIEYFQEHKTEKALEELNKLSSLNIKVIRNHQQVIISSEDVVVGDILLLEEGDIVSADGKIILSQSLGVDESSLTGESNVVYKRIKEDNNNYFKLNMVYSATSVTNGFALVEVTSVGINTEIGKIGQSLNNITNEKTLLESQVNKVVLGCTVISIFVCILTIIVNFINYPNLELSTRIVDSIISGITIAMATIPEEIPVVLTIFLALGARDLTKEKTLTKNMKAVETLGAVNVLCTDKTGTITENKMQVEEVYKMSNSFYQSAYLACPIHTYDSMDKAIKEYCIGNLKIKNNLVVEKEYPFNYQTKIMGYLYNDKNLYLKGAWENILELCHDLDISSMEKIKEIIKKYSSKGYRVIGVAKSKTENACEDIHKLSFTFEGLIALDDPPRRGIKKSLQKCYQAGIRVIMITGDNGITAKAIAKNIKLENGNEVITGSELEKMSDEELCQKIKNVNIFARVYPHHKMRIVKALQQNNNIVAMTGDGINDAAALKKANVGIAMGKRGTNVAKESADLILLDDNFNTIVKAIENGRSIYKNIQKAIIYILVIHIPVALLALFIPIFKLPIMLLPIHILLLELLIDPTSSIIFQRIKNKTGIMLDCPRNINDEIISLKTFGKCLIQGIYIFIIIFLNYYLMINNNFDLNYSITISYAALVLSIILVSFQLRSKRSFINNLKDSLNDKMVIYVNLGIILGLLLLINIPILENISLMTRIGIFDYVLVIIIAIFTILPLEIIKLVRGESNE